MKRRFLLLAAAGLALFMGGCEPLMRQRLDRMRDQAEQEMKEGNYEEAILFYEAALDGTPESAELHYQLGFIYDNYLHQPMSAVHHFQRYLALKPDGGRVKEVEGFIKEDHLRLITRFGNGAVMPQREGARLKNDNLALRKQVMELRNELEAASKARAALLKSLGVKAPRQEQLQKDLIPGVRTYTVQSGDTLASIARRFYKSPARWRDIQDANFNTLEGTAKLKPGMVLMIP